MKAFLSHSSRDKEFIMAVAKELGRQFCVVDIQTFQTGIDFKKSIEQGLDDSKLFVFFASKPSVESIWVNFELEEAWYKKLERHLLRSLVYIIDSAVTRDKLPAWMTRALISENLNAPKPIARDIQHHLAELMRATRGSYFVGRARDRQNLEALSTPLDGSNPPRIFVLFGLPGIGRRSLIREIVPNLFGLKKSIEIAIGDGDSINDLCSTVAAHIEPYNTSERLREIVHAIQGLSSRDAEARLIGNLRRIMATGEMPIITDEGGLLTGDGYFSPTTTSLLTSVRGFSDVTLFITTHRKPRNADPVDVPCLKVPSLDPDDTKRLLARLGDKDSVKLDQGQLVELAQYVAGYPPAAYFAIRQAKDYGLDLVMRDKEILVRFRTSYFLRHFARTALNDMEKKLLRLLALYSPLPLTAIAKATGSEQDPEKLNEMFIRLIDLSLVEVDEDARYLIAPPIASAATSAFGFPSQDENRALAAALHDVINDKEEGPADLSSMRLLFRAARLSGEKRFEAASIGLSNDLIRLVRTLYHQRNYEQAIKVGFTAVDERPDSEEARAYLVRALIQEERWDEATQHLNALRAHSGPRTVSFLEGFLARKHDNLAGAIKHYDNAMKAGRNDVAVLREISLCYMLQGDMKAAQEYVKRAFDKDPENRFVLDLTAQICAAVGDDAGAMAALNALELLDSGAFWYRSSRIFLNRGMLPEAEKSAAKAVDSQENPPFHQLAQYAYCLICNGNAQEAEPLLARIDGSFQRKQPDIRVGLRCRFEILRERFGDALRLSAQIANKDTIYYKRIRRDALIGELKTSALPDATRKSYEAELKNLEAEIGGGKNLSEFPIDLGDSALG